MSLSIVTIATDTWFSNHLTRWVRQIRMNVPGAKLFLYYMGDSIPMKHQLFREFEMVLTYDKSLFGRKWLNTVRMGACKHFNQPEMLYLDCDADVMEDINEIPGLCREDLTCCVSPAIHSAWTLTMHTMGWGMPSEEFNNGLLFMRKDFTDQYNTAWDIVEKVENVPNRIMGTIAFNAMLRDVKFDRLGYEYGTIWHDYTKLPAAKVVQWCNSEGQKRRVELEIIFRNALA